MPTSVFHTSSYPVERHFTDVLDSFTSPYGMFLLFFPVSTMDRGHFPLTRTTPSHIKWGGQGGGRPGEKGAGGVREAGEEGAGSGIPIVAGSGRKREKLCNIAQYFAIEKMQRGGSQQIQGGNRD